MEKVELIKQWAQDRNLDTFRVIEDFPHYVVDREGDVLSLDYVDKRGHKRKSQVIKQSTNPDGYKFVKLTNEEGSKTLRVHVLVAKSFITNPENKETVNHIDGDKENNKVENLEWSTRSEQLYHAYQLGLKKHKRTNTVSSNIKQSNPVKITSKETNEELYFLTCRDCSRYFGYSERWCDKILSSQNGETKDYKIELVSLEEVKSNTDKVTLNTLLSLIEYWAFDKGLHETDSFRQLAKLQEEIGELASGISKDKKELTKDSIGDAIVVLTILCLQQNLSLEECIDMAYNEIKGRTGEMKDGVFVKEEDLKK